MAWKICPKCGNDFPNPWDKDEFTLTELLEAVCGREYIEKECHCGGKVEYGPDDAIQGLAMRLEDAGV